MKKAKACHSERGGLILYENMHQKVIVYVDGFNFYYGLKADSKWKKYYWLDMVALFEKFLRPDQEIVAVKYFSAVPDNPDKASRQYAFFQANKENPKFKLILGKYLRKEITCFRCGNVIHTYEEKESDVRIATQIVADAYEKNCDIAIIVSADSDMIPAVELAKAAGQKIFIYFPPNHYSSNLSLMANSKPVLMGKYKARFNQSILPDKIHLKVGNFDLEIPEKWKSFRDTDQKRN
jgi:uncharacterized LabA/DUF88 family protein